MNLLKKLAVVIAASVGWMGSAQATTYELGTLSPTVQQESEFYAAGSTFADVYNFTVGAQYQTVFASAVGTSADQTFSNLMLTFYSGDGSVAGQASSSNGSKIDLSGAFLSGNYSVGVSGIIADGSLGGEYQFSIAAVPEPAEWMMLLAGLAVLGFIAKRKTNGLMAG